MYREGFPCPFVYLSLSVTWTRARHFASSLLFHSTSVDSSRVSTFGHRRRKKRAIVGAVPRQDRGERKDGQGKMLPKGRGGVHEDVVFFLPLFLYSLFIYISFQFTFIFLQPRASRWQNRDMSLYLFLHSPSIIPLVYVTSLQRQSLPSWRWRWWSSRVQLMRLCPEE